MDEMVRYIFGSLRICIGKSLHTQSTHTLPPLDRNTTTKKNGTPIIDVIIPIGKISPGCISLLNIDARDSTTAPHNADIGI